MDHRPSRREIRSSEFTSPYLSLISIVVWYGRQGGAAGALVGLGLGLAGSQSHESLILMILPNHQH
jgi:hypothetical protein